MTTQKRKKELIKYYSVFDKINREFLVLLLSNPKGYSLSRIAREINRPQITIQIYYTFLEKKKLIKVDKTKRTYLVVLSKRGRIIAEKLLELKQLLIKYNIEKR